MHHDAQKLTTIGLPARSASDSCLPSPAASIRSSVKGGRHHRLAARERVGSAATVAGDDLPHEQPEQGRNPDESDSLGDPLDGASAVDRLARHS